MKRKALYSIVFVFLLIDLFILEECKAQPVWFISPGVKVGYVLGNNGGFIYGFELSTTVVGNRNKYGVFISTEYFHSTSIVHFGIEVFPEVFYGLSIGPSFVTTNQVTKIGVSTTLFGGLFILPYYRFTYVSDSLCMHEVGTFLKLTIPMQNIPQSGSD
ncbi:MAG: hypothetical protein WAV76_16730 [Bacteroidota bacterium]